jgi:hypothetical protein
VSGVDTAALEATAEDFAAAETSADWQMAAALGAEVVAALPALLAIARREKVLEDALRALVAWIREGVGNEADVAEQVDAALAGTEQP